MPGNGQQQDEEEPAPRPNILRRISKAVDGGLTRFYRAEGSFVARRPWLVITIVLIITGACSIGFSKFEVEDDADKLYTPQDEPSFDDKEVVDSMYSSTESMSKIMGLDIAEGGANVLTRPHLLEHLRAWQQVMAATVLVEGRNVTYRELCIEVADPASPCKVDSILRQWNFDAERVQNDPNLLATLNNRSVTDYFGRAPAYNWLLGGVQRDQAGNIVRAEAMQTTVYLKYQPEDGGNDDPELRAMEEEITDLCYEEWSSPVLAQYVSSPGAIGREASEAINNDVSRLAIGYILLIIYTLIVLWHNSWAYHKLFACLGSFLAIGLAIATAFGLCAGLGATFNFVCQVLPFLLVGVGVDNTFVIVATYNDQDPDAPVERRIARAMELAGASVTVSCITNIIAFAVGAYTSLPALLSFATYSSVGMVFIFIYQVTFFVACLALDARREVRVRTGKGCNGCAAPGPCIADAAAPEIEQGLNGWTEATERLKQPLLPHGMSDADSNAAAVASSGYTTQAASQQPGMSRSNTGSKSAPDLELVVTVGSTSTAKKAAAGGDVAGAGVLPRDITSATCCCCGPQSFDPHSDGPATKLIARWLPAVSLKPWGKAIVIGLELVMLGFAIYGCTKVYMDFSFRDLFVPEGNWLHESYKVEEQYFGGDKTPVSIYTQAPADGRDYFFYQDELAAIRPALLADPYITDTPAPQSWYHDYLKWLSQPSNPYLPSLDAAGRPPNATAFNSWLREWLSGEGRSTTDDVVWSADNSTIISSRINAFSEDMVDSSWAIDMVDSARALAEATAPGLRAFAYGPEFIFIDGYRSIASSTVINIVIAACAVLFVMLLLLADIVASLEVFLMVVLADVGVLGSMHFLGLTFNSVTCIVLVLAVGVSVDYAAHIMRAFLVATGTRQARAHKALAEVGGAVWNGAVTTFLAVLPMAFAKHYIFTTIFKMFGILVLLAIWHGVVLLPVLLSLAGPASYREQDSRGASRAAAAKKGNKAAGDAAAAATPV